MSVTVFVSGSEVLDALNDRGSMGGGTGRLTLDDVVSTLRQDTGQTLGSDLRSLASLRENPLESPIQLVHGLRTT